MFFEEKIELLVVMFGGWERKFEDRKELFIPVGSREISTCKCQSALEFTAFRADGGLVGAPGGGLLQASRTLPHTSNLSMR